MVTETRSRRYPLATRQHKHSFIEKTMAMSPLGVVIVLECQTCPLRVSYEYLGQTLYSIPLGYISTLMRETMESLLGPTEE